MTTVHVALPEELFSSVRRSPEEVAVEMRLALAIRWYAQGLVSQGLGAQMAGLGRLEFMRALSDAQVSPFQESLEDVRETLTRE
jgi:predicted HTH domain antitoxin